MRLKKKNADKTQHSLETETKKIRDPQFQRKLGVLVGMACVIFSIIFIAVALWVSSQREATIMTLEHEKARLDGKLELVNTAHGMTKQSLETKVRGADENKITSDRVVFGEQLTSMLNYTDANSYEAVRKNLVSQKVASVTDVDFFFPPGRDPFGYSGTHAALKPADNKPILVSINGENYTYLSIVPIVDSGNNSQVGKWVVTMTIDSDKHPSDMHATSLVS